MKVFQYLNKDSNHPNWAINWGDVFCADMMSSISGIKYEVTNNCQEHGKILGAGSVITCSKPGDIVWGTGCIMPGKIGSKPEKILAVRGPLTREEALKVGFECPEIYGDPALLANLVWSPNKVTKTHEYGLIPHYIDYDHSAVENLRNLGVKIIDICQPTQDLVNEIHSVGKILSSSLHGLIIADVYNIPNARAIITDKLVGKDFKFEDYYASIKRTVRDRNVLTPETTISDLDKMSFNDKIVFDKNQLLDNSPWNK